MIKTAKQLKDKVRNLANGNGTKAQILIRNYMMERFLERCSLSQYRDHFILKGGMLVASVMGLDMRATMDIDTTVQSLSLSLSETQKVIEEIISIPLDDGVSFEIVHASDIMEEHEYPGIRFMLNGLFDKMRQPIKIDISTGDVITPRAIEYSYKLMFEERTISILSYNVETMLAEKLETILDRGVTNTRMRDYYDIHILLSEKEQALNIPVFTKAFYRTSTKRNTSQNIPMIDQIISDIATNKAMNEEWKRYEKNNYYVENLSFKEVLHSVQKISLLLSKDETK